MRRVVVFLAAPVFALSLACGGVWSQAMSQVAGDKAAEFRADLLATAPSPERDRALQAIDQLALAGDRATVMGVVAIETAVGDAVSDGQISAEEADRIARAVASM
jgi:hypothetical protein